MFILTLILHSLCAPISTPIGEWFNTKSCADILETSKQPFCIQSMTIRQSDGHVVVMEMDSEKTALQKALNFTYELQEDNAMDSQAGPTGIRKVLDMTLLEESRLRLVFSVNMRNGEMELVESQMGISAVYKREVPMEQNVWKTLTSNVVKMLNQPDGLGGKWTGKCENSVLCFKEITFESDSKLGSAVVVTEGKEEKIYFDYMPTTGLLDGKQAVDIIFWTRKDLPPNFLYTLKRNKLVLIAKVANKEYQFEFKRS